MNHNETIQWVFADSVQPREGVTVLVRTRHSAMQRAHRVNGQWFVHTPMGPMPLRGRVLFWALLPTTMVDVPDTGLLAHS